MCYPFGHPLLGGNIQNKRLEMGYTEAEFRKTLLGQFIQNTEFSAMPLNQNEWRISITKPEEQIKNATVNIKIEQAESRKIAMLELPVLNVDFEFSHLSIPQISNFMTIFFRYFHKGGG